MRGATIVAAGVMSWGLCCGAQAALQVTEIASGGDHNLALASDGTVWVWGPMPVRVSGLSGVVSIAAGGYDHDLAAKGDGTVWQWNSVRYGPVSGLYTVNVSVPVQAKELSGVVAVAASSINSLALKSDGTVWCWGWNCQPGKPSDSIQSSPVQVNGLASVVAIAGGQAHCLALKRDGTVWAWGHNGYGQLGDGTIAPVGWSPTTALVQVSGLTGVTAIAAGYAHSLALKGNGSVWTWGVDGSVAAYRTTPERVTGLEGVTSIAAGSYVSLAVKSDGTASWWGLSGWLNGMPLGQPTPVAIEGLDGIQKVAAPSFGRQRIALKNDGTVWDWGEFRPADAVLGTRRAPDRIGRLGGVKAVAAGGPGGLALTGDGTVWQWSDPPTPVQVSGLNDAAVIAMGSKDNMTLNVTLRSDGTLWEWTGESAPSQVADLAGVVAIAASHDTRLAVKGDGTVWEWSGQSPPAQLIGLSGVVAVAACFEWDWLGDGVGVRRLALMGDGTVWDIAGGNPAVQVRELAGIAAVACAGEDNVALRRDGTVWQWTWESGGRSTPVQVSGLTGIVAVAAGAAQVSAWSSALHGLALREDGTVWSWGDNQFGQLGDGTTTSRTSPVQVAGLRDASAIAAAGVYTEIGILPVSLAARRDGTAWAWGFETFGRLDRSKPIQVIQPGLPDLAIAMSHSGDFAAGNQGVYSLRITNDGWAPTAGAITVMDTLPPGLTYTAAFGDGWTCWATDNIVTCTNPGSITPGDSSTLTLTVRVEPQALPGVTNLAVVSNESDKNIANNTAGDPTVVRQQP